MLLSLVIFEVIYLVHVSQLNLVHAGNVELASSTWPPYLYQGSCSMSPRRASPRRVLHSPVRHYSINGAATGWEALVKLSGMEKFRSKQFWATLNIL